MSTPPRTAIEFRVRYAETDQMGVVYHANYLVWCEMARTELIRQRGPSYAELERDGVLLAVADVSMRFHSPARYDDPIRAESWIEEIRSRTVTFAYEILRLEDPGNAAPERLVTAQTRLIALGHDTRPRKLPPELIHALENG
ncbi:MAG: YbgC/FadM family acyl-CoA thioesterase [Gemmatimonas sp.]|nr:YbgC/FadM family acyl-CoA thioesterase [Gemmatimonas sp.]